MPALYVVHQNTKIRIRNRRVQVERDLPVDSEVNLPALNYSEKEQCARPEVLASVPLGQVNQVVLFGNIGLTTPAIDALLARDTEVVFLTRNGEYRGKLVGNLTPHVPLRRAQYRCLEQADFRLKMAQSFVKAKLQHQKALLLRNTREERPQAIADAVERLNLALEAVPRKTGLESLRGLEGSATAAYFSGLRSFFAPAWKFNNRNRRPPIDPVNVLLSFGYTLMAQAASAAAQTVGLDPFVGFLHEYAYNRPALALDIMEEFRPVVDGVVLWACCGGQLDLADFSPGPSNRPILLGDEGKRHFLKAFEQRMEQISLHPVRGQKLTLRQNIIEQARQVADCLLNDRPLFTGMGFR